MCRCTLERGGLSFLGLLRWVLVVSGIYLLEANTMGYRVIYIYIDL